MEPAPIVALMSHPPVQQALSRLAAGLESQLDLTVAIQQIPAPTFAEQARADFVQAHMNALGLWDVTQDALYNVYGRYPGTGGAPPVVVSAHSDTVFPAGVDLRVRREGALVHGPGIGDNAAGVAGVLVLAAALRAHRLRPPADIWFVINTREEGLGDLGGMRAVVDRFSEAAAFVVVEGGAYGCILHQAIGVRRYRLEVQTEGGHSWSDFGRTSAIHVLGQVIAALAQLRPPAAPKTTYNVGVIEGGTSVNTIAASASLLLDLRSQDPAELQRLISQVEAIIADVQSQTDARLRLEVIGDRPAGGLERQAALVQWADQALRAVGCEEIAYLSGSTDANVPLSRRLPAVCIGLARAHHAHRQDEYLDATDLPRGMQQLLLLTLTAASYTPG